MRNAAFVLLLSLAACSGEGEDDRQPMYELPQIISPDSPICLSYEPTTLNETRTFSTTLRNDGKQQLIISDGALSEDARGFFSLTGIEPKEVNTFDSAHLMIRYAPTQEGWDSALITVASNAQNWPSYRIFVLALGRPAGAPDTWDPGPKPAVAGTGDDEACKNDYKPRE